MKREKHDHRQESTTAEYSLLASILREASNRLGVAQMKTAKRGGRKAILYAIQETHDALAAAAHQAKRLP